MTERLVEYGCECGANGCDAKVEMTFSERDTADRTNNRWAIAPEHARPGDRILERHERYWIVAGPDHAHAVLPPDDVLVNFSCECGGADCDAEISMTVPEWNAVNDASHWAIAPGHVVRPNESVVERYDRFWVVADK